MATLRGRPYLQSNFLMYFGDGVTEGQSEGFRVFSGIGM